MKTMLLAIASMTLGTVLGFLVCRATARRLRRTTHGQRTAQKARDAPKKMGVMDKVLVLEGVILVAYTVAALVAAGVINTPDYWLANYDTFPSLDLLLCALGGAVK